jgi:predicted GNAT family acetyltransferase
MSDIKDNPALHRYELAVDGSTAIVTYSRVGDVLTLEHTEVPKALEGRGIGSRLARGVFDDIRSRGLKAKALCPFLRAWLERHPEYAGLAAP